MEMKWSPGVQTWRSGFSNFTSLTCESLTGGSPIWWGPHAVRESQEQVREGKSENPRREHGGRAKKRERIFWRREWSRGGRRRLVVGEDKVAVSYQGHASRAGGEGRVGTDPPGDI
jgi:hypothetical protein